jgi:phosphonopyruvate decarboxylase
MLLLIGWRGEPGKKDEPQHVKQGAITTNLLEAMGISYAIVDASTRDIERLTHDAVATVMEKSAPFVLVAREKTFKEYGLHVEQEAGCPLSREDALRVVLEAMADDAALVSTTGMASREIFEHRERAGQGHERDFLTVGSMGHASQIALGIALARPGRDVYCLDGDGAAIMHLGALATIGSQAPANFRHVLINNGVHDSVGGQPTAGPDIDFLGVAAACGYRACIAAESAAEIAAAVGKLAGQAGPTLLEIRVHRGNRSDLGRPTRTPEENKAGFMEFLRQ